MSDVIREILRKTLKGHEGIRLQVYDDATGRPIVPGTVVRGHPTIGWGRALDVNGITAAEAGYLLENSMDVALAGAAGLPGWDNCNDARRVVLASMCYQMGTAKVAAFKGTLAAIQRGDFTQAATNMLESLWAKQTPGRAQELAAIMRTGVM